MDFILNLLFDDEQEKSIVMRQALLARLPVPNDIPEDALNPIIIPPSLTLHEFLGNASGVSVLYISQTVY